MEEELYIIDEVFRSGRPICSWQPPEGTQPRRTIIHLTSSTATSRTKRDSCRTPEGTRPTPQCTFRCHTTRRQATQQHPAPNKVRDVMVPNLDATVGDVHFNVPVESEDPNPVCRVVVVYSKTVWCKVTNFCIMRAYKVDCEWNISPWWGVRTWRRLAAKQEGRNSQKRGMEFASSLALEDDV